MEICLQVGRMLGETQILGFSFNENFPVVAQLSLIFGNESRELLIAYETILIDRR